MISSKKAFTLMELLVVIAMIGIIMAAMTMSVRAAQERARIQKALSDVKVISQAILASENYNSAHELTPIGGTSADGGVDADISDTSVLKDLIGQGDAAESGGKIPALLMAALQGGGKMLDPWGTPYRIQIKEGSPDVKITSASGSMSTGYWLPNFYRLSAEERK